MLRRQSHPSPLRTRSPLPRQAVLHGDQRRRHRAVPGEGLEPPHTVSETAVLPLDEPGVETLDRALGVDPSKQDFKDPAPRRRRQNKRPSALPIELVG